MEDLDSAGRPWAEGVRLDEQEAARKLFAEGNALLKDSLFARAADKYREALTHWDHPGIYYNLSLALMTMDQPVEVYESLVKAMRYGPQPLDADKYERAQSYRTLLEQQLAWVEVVCDEPGAKVTLDGKFLFQGPGQRQSVIRAGEHNVVASKEAHLTRTEQFVLLPGDKKQLEITLISLSEVAAGKRRWAVWQPWAVVGAGAAVALGGGLVHRSAAQELTSFDEQFSTICPGNGCLESEVPELIEQLERVERRQGIAIGSYLLGGAAIASGLVMVYLNQPQVEQQGIAQTELSIAPVVVPAAAGVSAGVHVQGAW